VGASSPVAFTTAIGGSLILYADGSYTYTPPDDIPGSRGRVEAFDYTITDENGTGESSSAVLRITVSNPQLSEAGSLVEGTDGIETLIGTDHGDYLKAYGGDDILIGGKGNDILTGGTGADTFVWRLADVGTTSAPAKDVVMDFSLADNDILDLSDVLATNHSLTATSDGGKLKLVIHDDTVTTGPNIVQEITLSNIAVGTDDPTTILNSLKNNIDGF
jgi:Ca2+-binding RTX toxin-like protein